MAFSPMPTKSPSARDRHWSTGTARLINVPLGILPLRALSRSCAVALALSPTALPKFRWVCVRLFAFFVLWWVAVVKCLSRVFVKPAAKEELVEKMDTLIRLSTRRIFRTWAFFPIVLSAPIIHCVHMHLVASLVDSQGDCHSHMLLKLR